MRKIVIKLGWIAISAVLALGCLAGCSDPDAELKKNAQYNLSFWTAVSPASDKVCVQA